MSIVRRPHQKRWDRVPDEVRREVIRRAKAGQSQAQILREVDISVGSVTNILKPLGGVIRPELLAEPSGPQLSLADRIEIYVGLQQGRSMARIAGDLAGNRHRSTVCREVAANGGADRYAPVPAHQRAIANRRRPKATKLASNPRLCARVEHGLRRLWSPAQIAADLAEEFSDDPSMTISHETIYKSLYVQGRGELRRELTRCLRTGRAQRRAQGRQSDGRGHNPDMVMISQRPAEVADRAVPGHWEGDLILGKNGKSAVGTLVERTTRYVMLLHLPGDHAAATVRNAMTAKIVQLPAHLVRSITWDQGSEMAQHVTFTVQTGIPVYFCDPHSPWQRGTNENTNGLLRQYLPKGTDLSVHSPADLDEIAHSLNTRPRKTLGWKTPTATLADLCVASTG